MEHSTSWEDDSHSANQEVSRRVAVIQHDPEPIPSIIHPHYLSP